MSVYDDVPAVEFEWTIGSIPINDNVGKEIIDHHLIILSMKVLVEIIIQLQVVFGLKIINDN